MDDDLVLFIGLGLLAYVVYDQYIASPAAGGDGGDNGVQSSVDYLDTTDGSGNTQVDVNAPYVAGVATTGASGATAVNLTPGQIYPLAQSALAAAGVTDVTAGMLTSIAMIESSGNPGAVRQEPQINDASYGLCQTLLGTATWLANSQGATAYGAPTAALLLTPDASLYFAAVYLHYLRNYHGQSQADEWMVRAYNGGPGGASSSATAPYWAKYSAEYSSLGLP